MMVSAIDPVDTTALSPDVVLFVFNTWIRVIAHF
jgi:hypothetical protein